MSKPPLRTNRGSIVARHKPVGKKVANQIYVHKNYADLIIPENIFKEALRIGTDLAFEFNCVMYDLKTGRVRLDEAIGFDTEREPVVGNMLSIYPNRTTKLLKSSSVWHHKWMWVMDDYQGFDVNEAFEWSALMLSKLDETADGRSIARWHRQLEFADLPLDEF